MWYLPTADNKLVPKLRETEMTEMRRFFTLGKAAARREWNKYKRALNSWNGGKEAAPWYPPWGKKPWE